MTKSRQRNRNGSQQYGRYSTELAQL